MVEQRHILVTGGAGFIGSAVVRHLVGAGHRVTCLDKLTYASSLAALRSVEHSPRYRLVRGDIADAPLVSTILHADTIDGIMHLAAESHVDRSIDGPAAFVETNVVGTFRLLETATAYWKSLGAAAQARFRFHHVSTDEVFGDLPFDHGVFAEDTPYAPSSPYSASKAASDHFVRAWHYTYRLPVVVTNCSNNYGPFHFPDKLIPLTIVNALESRQLPVYGSGNNVRDWLHVEDHARALEQVLEHGRIGESYNIGGRAERTNLQVVEAICALLDQRVPRSGARRDLIRFVPDRPGHDRRYAINPAKIENELGWRATKTFEVGLANTVDWFLDNRAWWQPILAAQYGGQRLGLSTDASLTIGE